MAETLDTEALQAIIEGYASTKVLNYGVRLKQHTGTLHLYLTLPVISQTASGVALVVVDYLHTFPEEVALMWRAPLSPPTVLFFIFYQRLITSVQEHAWRISAKYRWLQARDHFETCQRSAKKLLAYLLFQYITYNSIQFMFSIPGATTAFLWFESVKCKAPNIQQDAPVPGDLFCALVESERGLLNGLFAIKLTNQLPPGAGQPFAQGVREGWDILLRSHISESCPSHCLHEGIGDFKLQRRWTMWMPAPMQVNVHAILAPRMLLHLRACAREDQDLGATELSTIQFKARFMPSEPVSAAEEHHV
ncbi:hypothetical protein FA13DRAFT_1710630 [Coprinellus micaceus]|uniref:DUF6533 domain-containing protein n=1 Tax=Coprinellus micaceus TaxID=71717 RepID=A0A4Y7T7P1_COPMI|nr:hypothetical protein FA13DRAFT_1710630 [Coprinellus micaceus]